MGRIDREELDRLAPADTGTNRHNHDHCPAGADTKRRLYVTRKEDGSVVGYCHNCGNSGVSVHRGHHHRRSSVGSDVRNRTERKITMPLNLEFDFDKWPKAAIDWVNKAGIPLHILHKYALAYDLDSKRVVIPKYNVDSELVMYQSRNVGLDDGPKYVTVKEGDKDHYCALPCGLVTSHQQRNTLVVVEDMLSAIKMAELGGYDALPLFSSNVEFLKLLTHLRNYDTIVVWLDNDNIEVRRHRDKLVQTCRGVGLAAGAMLGSSDPKHYSGNILHSAVESTIEVLHKERAGL
jgi:hypothetical protein